MSNDKPTGILDGLVRFAESFGSTQLVFLLGALFLADLLILDPIPFLDEIALGVLTILAARWRSRSKAAAAQKPPAKNVTPPKPPAKNVTPPTPGAETAVPPPPASPSSQAG